MMSTIQIGTYLPTYSNKGINYLFFFLLLLTYFVFNLLVINILPQLKRILKFTNCSDFWVNIIQTIGDTSSEPRYSQLNNVNFIPSLNRENELFSMTESHCFNMPELS